MNPTAALPLLAPTAAGRPLDAPGARAEDSRTAMNPRPLFVAVPKPTHF